MIWLHDSTFRPRLRYHFQIHPSQQLLVYVLYPIVSHEYPLYPHIFRWLFSGRMGIHMKSPIFSRWSHDRCEEFGTLTVGERPTALGIACLKLPAEVWIRSEAVSCSSGNQKKSTQLDDMFVMFSSAIHGGYVVLHHVPEISWVVATWDAVPNPIALGC